MKNCMHVTKSPANQSLLGSSFFIMPARGILSGMLSDTSVWSKFKMIVIAPMMRVHIVHRITPACAKTYGTPKRPAPSVPPMSVAIQTICFFVNIACL